MIGQTISHYHVLEKIGQGGMGEVFLAQDTVLNRKVALKFLPQQMEQNVTARKRFLREAQSAAALDHPFICHIHEIGEAEGKDFIAMEYVEGQTLKEKLLRGPLPLKEGLTLALEMVQALEKAHQKEIVHRDLKPSNIMVTSDGHVKVMDFGLAKQTSPAGAENAQEHTVTQLTEVGTPIGTPGYMSPEQIRGQPLDTRSDLFSLGVILYEMLTGAHPFRRNSGMETASAILAETPASLSQYTPQASPSLQQSLDKLLAKQTGERYQSIQEVHTDLADLLEDVGPRDLGRGWSLPGFSSRQWKGMALALALLLGIGLASAFMPTVREALEALIDKVTGPPPPPMRTRPFTSYPGYVIMPRISPSGQQIAFMWTGDERNFDIYVQLIGAGEPLRLTDHPYIDAQPTWSPDGRYIAFKRGIPGNPPTVEIIKVPALGGTEQILFEAAEGVTLDWSPDGRFIAFSESGRPAVETAGSGSVPSVHLLSLETLESHQLTFPPADFRGDGRARFSPDSQTLAFTRSRGSAGGASDIYLVPMSGGEPKRLTFDNRAVEGLAWTSDGREIVFSSDREGVNSLWRVSTSGGDPEALGLGGNARHLDIQGDLLAYVFAINDDDIWRMDGPASATPGASPTELIDSNRQDLFPQFSRDGQRITFASNRSGYWEIWVCDSDGSNPSQLTSFETSSDRPNWSPDGRQVVFETQVEGQSEIFVARVSGGLPRRLTESDSDDRAPTWSKDGDWIYFGSNRSGAFQIWKIPAQGDGEAVQVTRNGGYTAFESLDGKYLYYHKNDPPGIWRMPARGGKEVQILDMPGDHRRWAVWEGGICYVKWIESTDSERKVPAIHNFSFATEEATMIAIPPDNPFFIVVSPDGQSLLYGASGPIIRNIMLVENFR